MIPENEKSPGELDGYQCRLFDENLVHNIMYSTGLAVMEYLQENKAADADDVCDYIELNMENIVQNTINELGNSEHLGDHNTPNIP